MCVCVHVRAAAKQHESRPIGPYPELLIDGFDEEQVWLQIEMRNKPLLRFVDTQLKKQRRRVDAQEAAGDVADVGHRVGGVEPEAEDGDGDDGSREVSDDEDEDEDDEEEEDEEEEEEEGEDEGAEDEVDKAAREAQGADFFDEDDGDGEAGDDDGGNPADPYGGDGRLGKLLDQMDAFADEAERDDEDEDMEELYDDLGDEDDEADDADDGEEGEEGEEDEFTARARRRAAMMDDEDDDDDGEEEDDEEEEDEEVSDGEGGGAGVQGAVEAADDDSDDDGDEEREARVSAHARATGRMRAKLTKLEEAQIAEKPWQLRGEVTSTKRPVNSLLEADLDFDQGGSRAVPVVTEEVGACVPCLRALPAVPLPWLCPACPGELSHSHASPLPLPWRWRCTESARLPAAVDLVPRQRTIGQ